MQDKPVVSIIIPSYNYGHYLPETLKSALSNKGEKWNLDIIVVDDGSTDNTPDIIKDFGSAIRYIYQENAGPSAARNRGIQETSGDYVIFLDADDLLGEKTIENHLAHFKDNANLDVSVGMCKCVDQQKHLDYFWPLKSSHLDVHICHSNIAPIHSFMFNKRSIAAAESFNVSLRACEDYDFLLRIMEKGFQFQPNPQVCVVYNRHDNSLTSKRTQLREADSFVRSGIESTLRDIAGFPASGKYHAWLAYSLGCLSAAVESAIDIPELASQNMETGCRALMEAASLFTKKENNDPALIIAENYYAGFCYSRILELGTEKNPDLKKTLAFLTSRYNFLTRKNPEQLKLWLRNQFAKMLC